MSFSQGFDRISIEFSWGNDGMLSGSTQLFWVVHEVFTGIFMIRSSCGEVTKMGLWDDG